MLGFYPRLSVQAAASWIVRAAIAMAPADRAEWCAAMKAELEVLGDDPTALSWSWGALGTAFGWRLRSDAPILALLVVTPPLLNSLQTEAFFWLAPRLPGSALFGVLGDFDAVLLFALTLGLTILRPKLAVLSVLVVAFVGPSGLICWPHVATDSNPLSHFAAGLDNVVELLWAAPVKSALNIPHVHNWQVVAILIWRRLGPCVYGAAVGWGLARLVSRLGARSPRTHLT